MMDKPTSSDSSGMKFEGFAERKIHDVVCTYPSMCSKNMLAEDNIAKIEHNFPFCPRSPHH
jgi:hypothetical protein